MARVSKGKPHGVNITHAACPFFVFRALGATTLRGENVVVENGEMRLKFTGKKGIELDLPVTDPQLRGIFQERKQKAGDGGKLFNITASQLGAYAKTLGSGGYKTKDFRTHLGTSTARKLVADVKTPPKTEKELKKAMTAVAKKVSAILGNTPAVALGAYINPNVFEGWKTSVG